LPDAAGSDPMGLSDLGTALSFGAGFFLNATQERARKATQEEAYRVGLAIALAGEALASGTREDRGRSRRWICFFEASRALPEAQKKPITFITRLRLDAALYEPAPPRYPGRIGRPRLKGERLPNLFGCLPKSRKPTTGCRSRWHTGTAARSAPWRWSPGQRSGTALDYQLCHCVGC
jgi:hypothetical protein